MEITSEQLDTIQLAVEVAFVCDFAREHSSTVNCSFGWDSKVEEKDRYRDFPVDASDLKSRIDDAVASGNLPLGSGDFWIEADHGWFRFLLCHEGDIHFRSSSAALVSMVRARWEEQGYRIHERP